MELLFSFTVQVYSGAPLTIWFVLVSSFVPCYISSRQGSLASESAVVRKREIPK